MSDITGGWTDTELTERGRRQAENAANYLRKLISDKPTRIVTSDLKRALNTAKIIGEAFGVEPEAYPGLREFNNGEAAWKTKAEAERMLTSATEPLIDWRPFPGGETLRTFYVRVSQAMELIYRSHEENIVIIGHSGSLKHVTNWWLRLPIDMIDDVSYSFDNAAVTVLSEAAFKERMIERLNDASHLSDT